MNPIYERRILVGIASITATIILVGWLTINESARMQEFTERALGRSIEAGGRIFESNCSECHGPTGLGIAGKAPALNSPHLFGYSFFGEIDSQLVALNAALRDEGDPDRLNEIQTEIASLEAERQVIKETIYFDWTDRAGAVNPEETCADKDQTVVPTRGYSDAQLCELGEIGVEIMLIDQQIEALPNVDSAEDLPGYIENRKANELAQLLATRDDLAAIAEPTEEETAQLAQVEEQIATLEDELRPYERLSDQRATLVDKKARFQAVVDAHIEVRDLRMELAAVESELAALGEPPEEGDDPDAVEREALIAQSVELRTSLEAAEANRQSAYDVLVERNDIVEYDPENYSRLVQVGWAGSPDDFIISAVAAGRPPSSGYWPQPMPAWGDVAGGSLRPDQVRNLANFILAWDREFTIADVRRVNQFAKVPVDANAVVSGDVEVIGTTDVAAINDQLTALYESGFEPDPVAGQGLFEGVMGCTACHGATDGAGPAVTGLWSRVSGDQDSRLAQGGYTDAPELYLVESIAQPGAFVVPGFADGVMPQNFTTERLTINDLANLIAYLQTHDE